MGGGLWSCPKDARGRAGEEGKQVQVCVQRGPSLEEGRGGLDAHSSLKEQPKTRSLWGGGRAEGLKGSTQRLGVWTT